MSYAFLLRSPRSAPPRLRPPGLRLPAHGYRLTATGSRLPAHASRLTPPGSRLQAHASRLTPPGSRLQAHASGSGLRLTPAPPYGPRLTCPSHPGTPLAHVGPLRDSQLSDHLTRPLLRAHVGAAPRRPAPESGSGRHDHAVQRSGDEHGGARFRFGLHLPSFGAPVHLRSVRYELPVEPPQHQGGRSGRDSDASRLLPGPR